MAAKRVRVIVAGDVQGVGFRWFCREEAMGRGVAGFVRNLADGRVEAVFEGDSQATWFEGSYAEYEERRHELLGAEADQPHRIRYKPLVRS